MLAWYIYVCLFLFGLIIGSFLNVVILRFDTGRSIAAGRSICFTCGKGLTWKELIPLASFFAQGGKCTGCEARISWQYPAVEFATGFIFVTSYLLYPIQILNISSVSAFVATLVFFSLYVLICTYDVRHKVIPDAFSYGAAIVTLFLIAIEYVNFGVFDFSKIIAGPILFIFFFFFWFVSKGKWMGLGDAKLALSVGWFLGLSGGIAAVLLAFWVGSVVSLILIGAQRVFLKRGEFGLKSEIPFGPYILIGFFIVYMFGVDMGSILSVLAV